MQAAQDASDIASGKYKESKGFTQEKADAAYLEAKNAADLAVAKAKEAAGVTGDTAQGIWNKVLSLLSSPPTLLIFRPAK